MEPVVEVDGVSFAYDERPVIEDISLSIGRGELFGLVGPNGGGKTTLMKVMLGLLRPSGGSVRLFGVPAAAFQEGHRLGYVAQHATETEQRIPVTVREVVRMGRYPHVGLNGLTAADESLVDDALARAGIADLADMRVGHLSGGQKQRTYIARVLAAEADLLALDEPSVGIDADARDRFYDLLDDLNESGVTIILVEHDLGLVVDRADRVACINRTIKYLGGAEAFLGSDALVETFGTAGEALRAHS